jgi:hypothetical protein
MHYLIPIVVNKKNHKCNNISDSDSMEREHIGTDGKDGESIKGSDSDSIEREQNHDIHLINNIKDDDISPFSSTIQYDRYETHLISIYTHLDQNKESSKGMPKLRQFFHDYNPKTHCDVRGLSSIGTYLIFLHVYSV